MVNNHNISNSECLDVYASLGLDHTLSTTGESFNTVRLPWIFTYPKCVSMSPSKLRPHIHFTSCSIYGVELSLCIRISLPVMESESLLQTHNYHPPTIAIPMKPLVQAQPSSSLCVDPHPLQSPQSSDSSPPESSLPPTTTSTPSLSPDSPLLTLPSPAHVSSSSPLSLDPITQTQTQDPNNQSPHNHHLNQTT